MIKCAIGILVGFVGVGHGSQLDDNLGVDFLHKLCERMVVPGVLDEERDLAFIQQTQPLIDNIQIKILILCSILGGRKG